MEERFMVIPAVHLFLVKNDQILMLRRFNTGYEDGNYSVPAGHLNGLESATEAMIREAAEEVNIQINPEDLTMVHVMHRITHQGERIDFFFACKQWKDEIKINEPDKCDDLAWFKATILPGNTVGYVKTAIKHFLDGKHFSEHGW
jgi:8-oxo-dGTP diphosphatase